MTINPEAKIFFKRLWIAYVIILHLLVFAWSPYVEYTSDENGIIITIQEYNILLSKD